MTQSHQQPIAAAFKEKSGAIRAAEEVGVRAADFYTKHIATAGISKAQMAALGDKLRRAVSLTAAKANCMDFLCHQMSKLEKREEKGAKAASWCKKSGNGGQQTAIGDILIEHLAYDCFIPKGTSLSLNLLQLFWHQIETLYHYHAVTGQKAGIHKEVCRS